MTAFHPEPRTSYQTKEQREAAVHEAQRSALASYPGANGDVTTALAYTVIQLRSVIANAKKHYEGK